MARATYAHRVGIGSEVDVSLRPGAPKSAQEHPQERSGARLDVPVSATLAFWTLEVPNVCERRRQARKNDDSCTLVAKNELGARGLDPR